MKKISLLFASALALIALASCNKDEEKYVTPDTGNDESYYAAQASISSDNAYFTNTDDGGTILFKAEGGTVTVNVNCGCDWIAENHVEDLFTASATSSALTVTAARNTVVKELEGTITLKTATQRITFATISITQNPYGAPEISVSTNEWNAPAVGTEALSTEITVEASADWTAESADAWLTVEKNDTGITLTAAENENANERSTKVTLTCTDGIRTEYEYVTVNQEAKARITISSSYLRFSSKGGSSSVVVESNYDWSYSYDSSIDWLKITQDGNTVNISATENEGIEDRQTVIVFTTGNGSDDIDEVQLTVSQVRNSGALVLTYTTSAKNVQVTLPLDGEVDCFVDWGDGSELEGFTTTLPSHTYAAAGNYTVTIEGTVSQISHYSIDADKAKLLTGVLDWGDFKFTSMRCAFWMCSNLKTLPEETGDALTEAESFYFAFHTCSSLTSVPSDMFANCTKSTTFGYVFYNCTSLTTAPTFEGCSGATTFRCAFNDCTALTTVPEDMFSGCTACTNFYSVFDGCSKLKSAPTFKGCTQVTTFQNAFRKCSAMTTVPEDMFSDCTAVTTFYLAFYNCPKLTNAPSFKGCSSVTSFQRTFDSCTALTTVPEDMFDGCVSVISCIEVFYKCSTLKNAPSFKGCSSCTDFSYAFYNCTALTTVPEDMFSGCLSAATFKSTFYSCSKMTSLPSFEGCLSAQTFYMAFNGCSSVTALPEKMFAGCVNVDTFYEAFRGCTSLTALPEGLFDDCSAVTTFQYAFYNNTNLKTVPVSLFDKNLYITNVQSAFYKCSSIDGESPYSLLSDGTKVHLYERADHTSELGCVAPTTYSNCFSSSSFSDMSSIPSGWGGKGN